MAEAVAIRRKEEGMAAGYGGAGTLSDPGPCRGRTGVVALLPGGGGGAGGDGAAVGLDDGGQQLSLRGDVGVEGGGGGGMAVQRSVHDGLGRGRGGAGAGGARLEQRRRRVVGQQLARGPAPRQKKG